MLCALGFGKILSDARLLLSELRFLPREEFLPTSGVTSLKSKTGDRRLLARLRARPPGNGRRRVGGCIGRRLSNGLRTSLICWRSPSCIGRNCRRRNLWEPPGADSHAVKSDFDKYRQELNNFPEANCSPNCRAF